MKVDKEKDNLATTEIGWYVKEKCNDNKTCFVSLHMRFF